jgi:hypothetical protein
MGANARTKGQSGEREIVKIISPVVCKYYPGAEIGRNLDQTRDGGHDIAGVPNFAIEVKRQETLNLKKWWEQTVKQAITAQGRPVLIYRPNRKPWRAVISLYELGYGFGGTGYEHTLDMSLESFLLWFDKMLELDAGRAKR